MFLSRSYLVDKARLPWLHPVGVRSVLPASRIPVARSRCRIHLPAHRIREGHLVTLRFPLVGILCPSRLPVSSIRRRQHRSRPSEFVRFRPSIAALRQRHVVPGIRRRRCRQHVASHKHVRQR